MCTRFCLVDDAGYGDQFIDIIGHGVGIRQSESYPVIDKAGDHVIEENMVFDILLPTIYKKGAGGPRLTDTILRHKLGYRGADAVPRGTREEVAPGLSEAPRP